MKKNLIAAALLLVLLTACGAEETAPVQETEQPVQTEQTVAEETQPAQPAEPEEAPVEAEAPVEEPQPANPQLEQAKQLIDANVEELYDAIGYPVDCMYADSCLGEGEDGELYYNGFTVYTFRDLEDNETIYDVMENLD